MMLPILLTCALALSHAVILWAFTVDHPHWIVLPIGGAGWLAGAAAAAVWIWS